MTPLIRRATPEDLAALLAIERESFARPHWGEKDFLTADCIVAEIDGQIAGLLVSHDTFPGDDTSPPECEILNVAVLPSFRRQGVATALLRHFLARKAVYFLEVRESNLAAQQLYRNCGFSPIDIREKYYQYPAERAIVMQMKW